MPAEVVLFRKRCRRGGRAERRPRSREGLPQGAKIRLSCLSRRTMRPCSPTRHPAALLATCAADVTPAGFRDGAAIALLYATGLRRTEAVSLRLADYSTGAIAVLGKGNRERTVFACAGARRTVDAWTAVRRPTPRKRKSCAGVTASCVRSGSELFRSDGHSR